jgi:uncharacterized protein involved in exopolysaccharide biosynthesis
MEKSNGSRYSFSDFVATVSRWKRRIALSVLAVTVVAAGVSFLLPRWYTSSVSLLPPKNPGLSGLGGLLGGVGGAGPSIVRQLGSLRALGAAPGTADLYSYIAILKSRTLLERVVEEFDLITVYGIKNNSILDAVEELLSNVNFVVNEEGTLIIDVSDRDPQRAAAMANYFAKILDEHNRELSVREARGHRQFIEARVEQNLADLKQAEENLKEFQQQHGMVAVSEQVQGSMSALADLYATREKKALEVNLMRRILGENNPLLSSALLELKELDAKLQNVPDQGVAYLRLYREFIVQQRLFETLLPLLEQAKVEENRSTPTLMVLDSAVVPELPSKPRKRIIVLVFFLLSLIVSTSVAVFVDRLERLRTTHPAEYDKLQRGWRELFRWKK